MMHDWGVMNATDRAAYFALPLNARTPVAYKLANAGLPIEILSRRSTKWLMDVATRCGKRDQESIVNAIIEADKV